MHVSRSGSGCIRRGSASLSRSEPVSCYVRLLGDLPDMSRLFAVTFAALFGFGCATGVFGNGPSRSREDAISACVESVPAEAVPYADVFAACMEGYGWTHSERR